QVAANGGGAMLSVTSSTPSDGPGQFNNTLDPHLELYDDSDTRVAVGVPLADGRNESIQYQPTQPGNYRIRVTSEANLGEYALQLTGNLATSTPFQITSSSPVDGAMLTTWPDTFTVNLNRPYLATSLQKEDLLIDGIPSATDVSLSLGNSLVFSLPQLPDGP